MPSSFNFASDHLWTISPECFMLIATRVKVINTMFHANKDFSSLLDTHISVM